MGRKAQRGNRRIEKDIEMMNQLPEVERLSLIRMYKDQCSRIAFILILTIFTATSFCYGENVVPQEEEISDFEARLTLAKELSYNEGTFNEALAEYEELLKEKPEDVDIQLETAKIFIQQKKYKDAASHLKYVLDKRPADYAAVEITGDLHLYTNRLKDAVEYYRKAYAYKPSVSIQKKLALALSWNGNDEEALPLLTGLYGTLSYDKEIGIELARIYVRKDQSKKAVSILNSIHLKYPDDPDPLVEMADILSSAGHARVSRKLFADALDISKNNNAILLKFADAAITWGDFYQAERIYKEYLEKKPEDAGIMFKLGQVFAGSERYEEAEGLYRILLLNHPDKIETLIELSKLRLLEKDFNDALIEIERFLKIKPENSGALFVKAEALKGLKRYDEALQIYNRLDLESKKKDERVKALIEAGKICISTREYNLAKNYFQTASTIDSKDVEIRFFTEGEDNVTKNHFITKTLESEKASPERLTRWAELYAAQGLNKESIVFYEKAFKADVLYFPAYIGLAQVLAVDHQYERSLKMLQSLAALPDASKTLIWQARVLSWSKNYKESIEAYEKIEALNNIDPVPKKEKARVAVWGKMMDSADVFYTKMYTPAVDKMFLKAVSGILSDIDNPFMKDAFAGLKESAEKGTLYQGYEEFSKTFELHKKDMPVEQKIMIEQKLLEFLPDYRIQKSVFLENTAKQHAWNKRYIHALDTYEKLIDSTPGNEEAIFDYAQVQCSLGMCYREKATYNRLLNIDPLHNLAGIALKRQKIRSNPSLQSGYSYWMEDGRGDLSQITRNSFDFGLDMPLFCQYHLSLTTHRWLENPRFNHKTYGAKGYTILFNGMVNPFIKGEASWTHKQYDNAEVSARDTGHANLWFNLKDYVHFGTGYERTDELYNYFGIKHGTQADSWWAGARSDIMRRLEINGKMRIIRYNDNNDGQHHFISAGYAFTDHPKIFKVTMTGEYRDTKHENIFAYSGSNLIDITHPYWTPKNYTGAGLTLEWHHDYSSLFFCGNELRFYDIRVSFGADSENNPSVKVEGEWRHEFYDHWTISLKGMIHSSPQWSASGLWAFIKYQF
jgi:tetratricopeptide (TPR) repeat protein